MTYCEEHGHKIGDQFRVMNGCGSGFSNGEIVELYLDDGSILPKFISLSTGEGWYESFDNLEKITETPSTGSLEELPELLRGSGLTLSINSDGSIAVYDNIRERSCLVGSMGAATTLIKGLKEVEEKINELADWA